ncbi:hypothetical protein BVRB_9g207320 [Beta vulgaris subsp. vulgaris]|nr:hypothetical protein BVRB_9g207320 [Beta vulgaris subsp. vulgaris]
MTWQLRPKPAAFQDMPLGFLHIMRNSSTLQCSEIRMYVEKLSRTIVASTVIYCLNRCEVFGSTK